MKKILWVAILALAVSGSTAFAADYYIKQISHTDAFAMMGQEQPARDDTIHMWLGDNRMAMEMPQMKVIIDLGKDVMYWINHQNKSYVEMTLPLDLDKYFPAQVMQMMGDVSMTVAATGEKQTFGRWDCAGYDMTVNIMMMEMKQKIWASTDVPFDWKDYSQKMMPKLSQAMMRLGDESLKEMLKIEGFQIRTETTMNMMGSDMKTWQEVQEITKKDAPAGTYGPPEGYTKKDKLDLTDIQR
jgi:hypothetical protein